MKKKSTSESAFFKLRLLLGVLLCFAGITIVLLAQPRTPSGQSGNSQPIVQAQFRGVLPVVKFDISPPLRDMKPLPAKGCTLRENEDREIMPPLAAPLGPVVPDPVGSASRLRGRRRSAWPGSERRDTAAGAGATACSRDCVADSGAGVGSNSNSMATSAARPRIPMERSVPIT